MKEKYYNKLKRDIYITRKSRINLSEKFILKNKCWNSLNFIYSLYLIGLAILGLKNNIGTTNYNLLMLFLSVSVTMISLYSNTKNYKERSLGLKFHYIKLQSLYDELSYLDFNTDFEKIKKIATEYFEELRLNENHTSVERYFAIKDDSYETAILEKIGKTRRFYYYLIFYIDYIWLFVYSTIPMIFLYLLLK